MFLTIDNDMLAISSSKGATGDNGSGYVTVADLSGNLAAITLTDGIEHPVGAAAAFGFAGPAHRTAPNAASPRP